MKTDLYVVGIGPGGIEGMTIEAYKVLEKCDVLAGYTTYAELVKDSFPNKEWIVTPMRKEKERCILALESAENGKTTAMICSGDSGIYGMAGLILELSKDYPNVNVMVIAGVTAAASGAAVLGAPLMHDFCCISLSDWLTPMEKIEKRLRMAAEGDFVICLYNPSSRVRKDYLKRACEILLETLDENTACGVVRNIGREGEMSELMTLGRLKDYEADMFTTVFIGNKTTAESHEYDYTSFLDMAQSLHDIFRSGTKSLGVPVSVTNKAYGWYGAAAYDESKLFETEQWHKVDIFIDQDTKEYRAYLDGALIEGRKYANGAYGDSADSTLAAVTDFADTESYGNGSTRNLKGLRFRADSENLVFGGNGSGVTLPKTGAFYIDNVYTSSYRAADILTDDIAVNAETVNGASVGSGGRINVSLS